MAAAGATLGLALAAALLGRSDTLADASTVSSGTRGWRGARAYLERRGHETHVLSAPEAPQATGILVCAFPWQVGGEVEAVAAHARNGGTLLLAYDGESMAFHETALLHELGMSWQQVGSRPPLNPLRWREAMTREWPLRAEGELEGAAPVMVRALRRVPRAPDGARVLYRAQGRWPAVFDVKVGDGRVIVLPAEALSNARLFQPGNADLLETLSGALVEPWWFDEYHHGLSMPTPGSAPPSTLAFDVAALHLVLLYVLAVAALARRFGPAWAEPPALAGSTGTFLLGLGALHHRLGHHQAAARLLLDRVRQFDRSWSPSPDMVRAAHAADADALVELAREVARPHLRTS